MDEYIGELKEKGYVVIPGVLSDEEVDYAKGEFYKWFHSIDNLEKIHKQINPHNIFKYHQVGHQRFAWFIRTRPMVKEVFAKIWKTDNLVVSFDGACYMKEGGTNISTNCWTHTDQAPKTPGFICVQGFVSLTDNKKASLQLYEGSHLLHQQYFKDQGIEKGHKDWGKNWQIINQDYLKTIKNKKKILEVPKGSIVLWDSRTFHQNICLDNNEERLVQYVSMLPKEHKLNTKNMHEKRVKYFKELRTTSHWCYPIRVNSLQPRTYGNDSVLINYDDLQPPNIEDLLPNIKKLL